MEGARGSTVVDLGYAIVGGNKGGIKLMRGNSVIIG